MFKKKRYNFAKKYTNESFNVKQSENVIFPNIGIPLVLQRSLADHWINKREASEE